MSDAPMKARDMVALLADRIDDLEERIIVLEDALKAKQQQQKPPKKQST
jgi:hypothetical protein